MPLFGGRRSMLEVQNQALIKTARERAERIDKLERELQSAAQYSLWGQRLERELNRIDPDGAPSRRFGAKGEE